MNELARLAVATSLSVLLLSAADAAELRKLKVGATAGPHAEVLEFVKEAIKKDGIDLEVVEFSVFCK